MDATRPTLSPRQTFEDNMRPAKLLLHVYRLMNADDKILTEGKMVDELRKIVSADIDEELMLVYNELFLGLVRQRADMPRSTLRHATLCHLLRQSVVASCTALETYLPALLKAHMPLMIQAKGRDFMPRQDKEVMNYLAKLQFGLDDILRWLTDENAPELISNKVLGYVNFNYLSGHKGVHFVGSILGVSRPWEEIGGKLKRDVDELKNTLEDTVKRRHSIVHRADRSQSDPGGEAQEITYAWSKQAVDTTEHICLALDELVSAQVKQLQALLQTG